MKITSFERRIRRVRGRVKLANRPRLTVHRTNKAIYGQIIDVTGKKTLVSFSSGKLDKKGLTKTQQAEVVGEELARLAKVKKVSRVVFDRGGYKYHGRIKALAEAARRGGLDF